TAKSATAPWRTVFLRSRVRCTLVRTSRSSEQPVEPVAQPEIAAHQRQKPGIASVERMIGKLRPVECANIVAGAGDLAGSAIAEIGHHRDAAAIAAEAVMQALLLSHMRQRIEGEGGVAVPTMRDPDSFQLRPPFGHIAVEDAGAQFRIDMRKARP